MNQMHYVSVFIDTESRRLYICDSLPDSLKFPNETIILMRKWIAKSMSLVDYYIKNNDTEFDLSFGSGNVVIGVEFNDEIKFWLKNNEKKYFMYEHNYISEMKGILLQ